MTGHSFLGVGLTMLTGPGGRLFSAESWQGGVVMVLEAALRSAVMGAVVYAVLQLLQVRQVRAQRYAWLLTLMAALAMPALVKLPQTGIRMPVAARHSVATMAAGRPGKGEPAGKWH